METLKISKITVQVFEKNIFSTLLNFLDLHNVLYNNNNNNNNLLLHQLQPKADVIQYM